MDLSRVITKDPYNPKEYLVQDEAAYEKYEYLVFDQLNIKENMERAFDWTKRKILKDKDRKETNSAHGSDADDSREVERK